MVVSGEPDRESLSGKIPIVIISGPTCSGKSSLALKLAGRYEAEIISADSRQIYRQLKIGTDRLDEQEWQGIRHHLMGSVDLDQRFTVFDFVRQAQNIIDEAYRRKMRIIVCGGTGLYLRALTDGIFELPDEDLKYRNELLGIVATHGVDYLYRMLGEVDPEAASDLHPHNLVRVIRALEIYHLTGLKKNELAELPSTKNERYQFLHIIILPDRTALYQRIEKRVLQMIEQGLVEEAEAVYQSDYRDSLRQRKVVGYAELLRHFDGELSRSEAINLIMQNTRRYAKRQFTWFRAVKTANFLEYFGNEAEKDCIKLVEPFWIRAS
jgi:tRNA dimethylallyltransferase